MSFCAILGGKFPLLCPPTVTTSTTTTPNYPNTPPLPGSPPSYNDKLVVGYISSWKEDYKSFILSTAFLTHAIFAFIPVTENGTLSISTFPPEDVNRLYYFKRVKTDSPRLKTLFSIGAWGNSQFFTNISSSSLKMDQFTKSVLEFIKKWDMDGVDIDWESPVTGGAQAGRPEDRENFVTLLKALRTGLDSRSSETGKPYLLTIAASGGIYSLQKGFDLIRLSKYVDWFNIMAYDFYGAWKSPNGLITGPHAPLYFGAPSSYTRRANVDYTSSQYYCQTDGLLSKMVLGLGFYGRYWNNSGSPIDSKDPLWRIATTTEGDILDFRRVKRDFLSRPDMYTYAFHKKVEMPYLLSKTPVDDPFLMGYEDMNSIRIKVQYAMTKGMRGVMIWAVEYDDVERSLLSAVNSVMTSDKDITTEKNPYKCSPLPRGEVRWWVDGINASRCGKDVPLVNGYYAICDPENPDAGCCSDKNDGKCGIGADYCDCPECTDYYNHPELANREPVKPTRSFSANHTKRRPVSINTF